MKPPTEKQAGILLLDVLSELFDVKSGEIRLKTSPPSSKYDFSISVPPFRFIAEYKMQASAGQLTNAVKQLKQYTKDNEDKGLPLIVVPFMGTVGRQLCTESQVSWLDLSGNANIDAPGLKIRIEGRANKYSDRGRPPNVFASKSSRVIRQLLFEPDRFQTQADLARKTGLGDGYVSKIVRRLQQEEYVVADDGGAIRARDSNLLLDAWQDAYDFDRHRVLKGHVPARSGEELLERLVNVLSAEKQEYAATGLSAAWLLTHFATFRLVTVYLSSMPPRSVLNEMEFLDEPKGANVWLVLPDDEGVFHGGKSRDDIFCVSPIQVYLDLKGQPERAKDAAVELRRTLLHWG